MKFSCSTLFGLSLAAAAVASPFDLESRQSVQVAHLTFHGGPASYELAVPADGSVIQTNNNIAVDTIDAPDYNAISQCTFNSVNDKTLETSITEDGLQQIIVGPPTPITSVSCQGMCVPTYGECYTNGQFVGPCCAGFCAGTRCRPWNTTGAA